MNKIGFVFIISIVVLSFCVEGRGADLLVSATMVPGTFSVVMSKVDSKGTASPSDDVWTKQSGVDLSFGELKELKGVDPVTGKQWSVILPKDNVYYAVDCGITGGGCELGKSISVSFAPGTNGDKLGERAIVSYERVIWQEGGTTKEFPLDPEKKLLKDSRVILFSEVSIQPEGGWLRLYIGINDGQSNVPGAKTFSSLDPAGTYSGNIVISML